MNDCEGHQRSFSVRPSERPLHLQDRALASGWHQAIGEGPVSHRAKWHSRPIADLAEYEIDVWKPLLKAPFSTKEPDPMLRIARSVLNA